MLVSFTIENWMSFREPATLSMVASRERQHGERVPKIGRLNTRILPVATIYGGNASGKTNLFKALSFAKTLVIKGTQPDGAIQVEPFHLDTASQAEPTRFVFELLIEETLYEFAFSLTREAVVEERLSLITSSSEKELYRRSSSGIEFEASLKDPFLQFAFQGTRDNQLFLTNAISQKVERFRPIYNWFRDTLELIGPDSRFEPFELFLDDLHPLYGTMNQMLSALDTGISRLGGEEIPLEHVPISEPLKRLLQEEVKEGMSVRLMSNRNDRLVFTRRNNRLTAQRLVTFHRKTDGSEARFEMHQESDGSQRVIDLLPAFLELSSLQHNKVFVVDELDRSLHTLLTRKLLETYLGSCSPDSRSQLLLTTHDLLLMDQELFRRDEMWIAERKASGATGLLSFSEYKDVRYDKDIRKSYLQGRLGGIPQIGLGRPAGERRNSNKREAG
jgi:AAA15 family ATPase/GTPase